MLSHWMNYQILKYKGNLIKDEEDGMNQFSEIIYNDFKKNNSDITNVNYYLNDKQYYIQDILNEIRKLNPNSFLIEKSDLSLLTNFNNFPLPKKNKYNIYIIKIK